MGHGEGGGSGGGVLRELLAVFGFGLDTHELEHGESKLDEFFEKVKHVGEGIAAAFAVDELFEFAEGQAHAMTAVEHMAARIGISTEEVQAWGYAAKASGFEAEAFTTAMSRLQAVAGSGQGSATFGKLGISLKSVSGEAKNVSELFADVAEKVKETEDPNKRAAIATQLFGRSGRELLPFLSEGREGIEELMEAYKQLGGAAYTEEDIERTKKFEKAQASLSVTWTSLKATIARVLLPIFTKLSTVAAKLVEGFVDLSKNSNIVKATLLVLGAAASYFAVQMAIAAAPVLLIAAAIAALILIVDEIITLFSGGDTLIGDAIDKMFGKDAHVELVEGLKTAWEGVKNAFVTMWPYVKKVWDAFAWIFDHAERLGAFIGDQAAKAVHPEPRGDDDFIARFAHKHGWLMPDASAAAVGGGASVLPHALTRQPSVSPWATASSSAPGAVNVGDTHVGVEVKIGDEPIKAQVHQVIKQRNRETVNTLPRSGQP